MGWYYHLPVQSIIKKQFLWFVRLLLVLVKRHSQLTSLFVLLPQPSQQPLEFVLMCTDPSAFAHFSTTVASHFLYMPLHCFCACLFCVKILSLHFSFWLFSSLHLKTTVGGWKWRGLRGKALAWWFFSWRFQIWKLGKWRWSFFHYNYSLFAKFNSFYTS